MIEIGVAQTEPERQSDDTVCQSLRYWELGTWAIRERRLPVAAQSPPMPHVNPHPSQMIQHRGNIHLRRKHRVPVGGHPTFASRRRGGDTLKGAEISDESFGQDAPSTPVLGPCLEPGKTDGSAILGELGVQAEGTGLPSAGKAVIDDSADPSYKLLICT